MMSLEGLTAQDIVEQRRMLSRGLMERAHNDAVVSKHRRDLLEQAEREVNQKLRKRVEDYSPPQVSDMDGAYEKMDRTSRELTMAAKSYGDNLAEERESVANQVYLLNESHRRWRAERKKRFIDMLKAEYYGPQKGVGRGVQLLRLRGVEPL
jgi:hypothetical protein